MYVPSEFAVPRDEIAGLLTAIGTAHLVTCVDGQFDSTVLPVLVDLEAGIARAHIARSNPHWRAIDAKGHLGVEALAIVAGADGYITPSWYPTKQLTGKVVPTWNYEVVHLHGRVRVVDDMAFVESVVRDLTERHEAFRPEPWHVDDAPAGYIHHLLATIVGVEMTVRHVEAKRKLSQNRPDDDRLSVIAHLAASDDRSRRLATRMPPP